MKWKKVGFLVFMGFINTYGGEELLNVDLGREKAMLSNNTCRAHKVLLEML